MPANFGDLNYIFIMVVAMALGGFTQLYIKRTYKKWSGVANRQGITGLEAAQRILANKGLGAGSAKAVGINRIQGNLTDHYDPRTNQVSLSAEVYDRPSVSAVAIAAHEVGHAIQHNKGYVWSNVRSAIVPLANLGSNVAGWLIILGLVIQISALFWAGIIAYGLAVGFQLVTLPVELNASKRALVQLKETGIVNENEEAGARQVLTAAALTYIAGTLISLMYLVYYIGLSRD